MSDTTPTTAAPAKKQKTTVQTTIAFGMGLVRPDTPNTTQPEQAPPSVMQEEQVPIDGGAAPEPDRMNRTQSAKPALIVRVVLSLRTLSATPSGVVISMTTCAETPKVEGLKPKRRYYTEEQKKAIKQEAAKLAKNTPGFEGVQTQQVKRWSTAGPPKKLGRPINDAFEQAVLDKLVYTSVAKLNTADDVAVIANVAYSYATIRIAAVDVQGQLPFSEDPKVQAMKFSDCWIIGWLQRRAMRRRRVTAQEKQLPPVIEVQESMFKIQEAILDGGYASDEVISSDETGVMYGMQPINQYVPIDAARATAPEADDKARFTLMLAGDRKGNMAPVMAIAKCSSAQADLSRTRVLQNLMKIPGLTADDGWELRTWKRTLTLTIKNKEVTKEYVRPYLYHTRTYAVITLQKKAWMDTVGVCMWYDLSIGPHFKRKRGKGLNVWDNCGPHGVPAVEKVAAEWGIKQAPLPPKMTDHLQVMDLVANGPMKAGIRRARTKGLFDYFQGWKIKRLQAEAANGVGNGELPPFAPPKPTLADGLLTALKVCEEVFTSETFQGGMRRSFVSVGLSPQVDGSFVKYSAHRKGKVYTLPNSTHESEKTSSLSEVASELIVETRGEILAEAE